VHSNVYVSAMSEAPAPQTGTASLRIGALAARAEVTVDTLRLYEKLGLLPRPARTPAANLLSFNLAMSHLVGKVASGSVESGRWAHGTLRVPARDRQRADLLLVAASLAVA
jgi:hypothetical protein